MTLTTVLLASWLVIAGSAARAHAQDAQAEQSIMAGERALHDAVVKGNLAGFKQHVAVDGWAVDGVMGRMATADYLKSFDEMVKGMDMMSWDITDSRIQWVDANTAIHTYQWIGKGTYQGRPIPSPVWSSTVWTRRSGKWTAVFHQESASVPQPDP